MIVNMKQSLPRFLKLFLTILLLSNLLHVEAKDLFPVGLRSSKGSHEYSDDDEKIRVLRLLDSSSFVTLTPKLSNKYTGKFTFRVPKAVDVEDITSIRFDVALKLLDVSNFKDQWWKFLVRNLQTKKWETLKSTKNKIDSESDWTELSRGSKIIENLSDYMNTKNEKYLSKLYQKMTMGLYSFDTIIQAVNWTNRTSYNLSNFKSIFFSIN